MQKKQRSKKRLAIPIGMLVLLVGIGVFLQFTPIGYRMTVPYRGFDRVQDGVYIDKTFSGDTTEILQIVNNARDRVSGFFGNLESSPMLIISDNAQTLKKLGGTHDTMTVVLWGAHCYISVSNEYMNVDVVAHELTHAELHQAL